LPFERDSIDVVISNCVLNLVPDKPRAFAEIYRVLRPGAHFCVSDVVASASLPDSVRNVAALYVGCVAGAEAEEQYLRIIRNAGFKDAEIVKSQRVDAPDNALAGLLPADAIAAVRKADLHIKSVTVIGTKPPS
jgi:SAM-dependent methyltransferase